MFYTWIFQRIIFIQTPQSSQMHFQSPSPTNFNTEWVQANSKCNKSSSSFRFMHLDIFPGDIAFNCMFFCWVGDLITVERAMKSRPGQILQ